MADRDGYTPDRVYALIRGWATLRSTIEQQGLVEAEVWCELLDIERALRLMADPERRGAEGHHEFARVDRAAKESALVIAGVMLLGFSGDSLRIAMGKTRHWDPKVRMERGAEWIASYLNGESIATADDVFRPKGS